MRAFLRIAKAALLALQVLMLAGWVWLFLESRTRPPAPAKPETAMFEIGKGRSVRSIASELKAKGLLRKSLPFILRYRFFYAPQSLKAGEYRLPLGGSAGEVLDTLIKGRIYLHPLTLAEGLTGKEIIADIVAAGFGQAEELESAFRETEDIALWDRQASDLEGYLFPETYRLPRGIAARDILRKMTAQFKSVFGEVGRRRAAELGMSVRDVVTLASLIEKETSLPDEKRLVSAVFHNRLRIGMKLDCDPTIIYALKRHRPFESRLRTKDLKFDSPYNTYLYPGLPPGPIANPGRESLEAALNPGDADFFYFVARNDGSHQFSRTFAEHRSAVNKYRR